MKNVIAMLVILGVAQNLSAKESGAHVQNQIHYKVKKNIAGPDEIIVESAEMCDPKEETRMPFFN